MRRGPGARSVCSRWHWPSVWCSWCWSCADYGEWSCPAMRKPTTSSPSYSVRSHSLELGTGVAGPAPIEGRGGLFAGEVLIDHVAYPVQVPADQGRRGQIAAVPMCLSGAQQLGSYVHLSPQGPDRRRQLQPARDRGYPGATGQQTMYRAVCLLRSVQVMLLHRQEPALEVGSGVPGGFQPAGGKQPLQRGSGSQEITVVAGDHRIDEIHVLAAVFTAGHIVGQGACPGHLPGGPGDVAGAQRRHSGSGVPVGGLGPQFVVQTDL